MNTSRTRTLTAVAALLLLAAGWADTAGARPCRGRARPAPSVKSEHGVVNLNTATEAQLELLPGIGPSKSRSIVRYRTRRKFRTTYELIRVRGIGRKTYRKLRPYLAVKGPTTLTARPPRPVRPGK